MTEKNIEIITDALDDFDTDLQSLWDESDDDGVAFPDNSAESDEETEGENEEGDEGDTADGGGEESSDAGEGDDAADDENDGDSEEAESEPDYKALWERAQHEVKTMAGRLKAAQTRPIETEVVEQAPRPVAAAQPSAEEEQFLAQFKEKYSDDVIQAINIIATRQATQLVESTLHSRLAPVEQTTQNIVSQAHFAAIEAVHPDLEEIDASPVFASWLENRPVHLKAAYEAIRERGTPAQVIAMLSEYKQAIGADKKPQAAKPSKATKVAAATAVGRRRGTVQVPPKAANNDLAALWDEIDD